MQRNAATQRISSRDRVAHDDASPHTHSTIREIGVVIGLVIALQAVTAIVQDRIEIENGRGYDGALYYQLSEQFASGERPQGVSRAANRIGTPFLAALVDSDDLINGFTIVNVSATFISSLLLLFWFRTHLWTPWLRIALVVLYATHWLQLIRFTFFYPVLADAWAQAFCFAGLNCIAQYERKPRLWPLIALCAISGLGVLFREIVLLIPVAFLFARNPQVDHRVDFPYLRFTNIPRWSQWLPLILGVFMLAWVRNFVIATDSGFSASQHLMDRAYDRRLITYALGWVVAFGPALFVVLFDYRTAVSFLSRHKAFLVYALGVALVGWAASLESERHALNWGAPIVYLLLGLTIERHMNWFRSAALVTFLLVTQAVVHRAFFLVPQPDGDYREFLPTVILTPLGEGASYLHLFPDYLAAQTVWVQSAEYVALAAVIVTWLSRRVYLRSDADASRLRPRRLESEPIARPRP